MFWTGLGCLIQCINSIVWNGNIVDRAPIYCDIGQSLTLSSSVHSLSRSSTVTRIQVALNVAIPACSFCINRRLYKIATMKAVMITRSERRRAIISDLLLGLGLPIVQVCARECVFLSACPPVAYKDAIQTTWFRRIVTIYLRILALTSPLRLPHQRFSSSTRGPWRSVL
jgi:hypothetical protein